MLRAIAGRLHVCRGHCVDVSSRWLLSAAHGGRRQAAGPRAGAGSRRLPPMAPWAAAASSPVSTGAAHLPPGMLAKARKLSLVVGSVAGAFGSLVGAGGGVLIAPLIIRICPGIPQRLISGTSLAAVATTGATAGYVYYGSGSLDTRSAVIVAAAAVLTAPLGARCTSLVDCQTLRRALGWWLCLVAPLVPLKAMLASRANPNAAAGGSSSSSSSSSSTTSSSSSSSSSSPGASAAATLASSTEAAGDDGAAAPRALHRHGPSAATDVVVAATGALAGFASGLLGIGGGTVVTPLLAMATGMPQQQVLGTSLAAMVVPSLVGLAQHTRLGNVDWRMAGALAVGTTVGSYVGGCVGVRAPDYLLEVLFAVGMLLLGRQTLQGARRLAAAAG